jgi:hypothetical protein
VPTLSAADTIAIIGIAVTIFAALIANFLPQTRPIKIAILSFCTLLACGVIIFIIFTVLSNKSRAAGSCTFGTRCSAIGGRLDGGLWLKIRIPAMPILVAMSPALTTPEIQLRSRFDAPLR